MQSVAEKPVSVLLPILSSVCVASYLTKARLLCSFDWLNPLNLHLLHLPHLVHPFHLPHLVHPQSSPVISACPIHPPNHHQPLSSSSTLTVPSTSSNLTSISSSSSSSSFSIHTPFLITISAIDSSDPPSYPPANTLLLPLPPSLPSTLFLLHLPSPSLHSHYHH
ncbi:hypothetical protein E2C01_062245 [Portunus trituberculatus]|uniref:Uncharacterized protein n=1 Tax=Portunus trituberculatus TaxID=210409 RepID=A0A5B7HEL4_PORTR|nr:hypothetical protein [Portunus trituberculatus]